jgi:hypothetical protein
LPCEDLKNVPLGIGDLLNKFKKRREYGRENRVWPLLNFSFPSISCYRDWEAGFLVSEYLFPQEIFFFPLA